MAQPAKLSPTNLTNHASFLPTGPMPIPGVGFSVNVFIENLPAIPAGSQYMKHDIPTDIISCIIRPPHRDEVMEGCPTVWVNGQPMARVGDKIQAPLGYFPSPLAPAGTLRLGATTVHVDSAPGIPYIGYPALPVPTPPGRKLPVECNNNFP